MNQVSAGEAQIDARLLVLSEEWRETDKVGRSSGT